MDSKQYVLLHLLFSMSIYTYSVSSIEFDYPAVFNFGDSNSDTGNMASGLGFWNLPPNGMSYFHKPVGRFSDGRLIIDFLMNATNQPFLPAYLDSLGAPSFKKGCNFAAGGATIQRQTMNAICPFSFNFQINQFIRFKARAMDLLCERGEELDDYLPAEEAFQKGLYTFDIGQNDLSGELGFSTSDQVIESIPKLVSELEDGIKLLYNQGARNFWIHNTGPLGCLPAYITRIGNDPSKLDEIGCSKAYNEVAQAFNLELHELCIKLQQQYSDANLIYVDIYAIKLKLITNYAQYGFDQPIMACCGNGGPPLNYNREVGCGATNIINGNIVRAEACNDSSKYVNWDGIHYTEASNQIVASEVLSGKYTEPAFFHGMPFFLNLRG